MGRCPHVPLERWQEAEKVGHVLINDRVASLQDTVTAGESVKLLIPDYVEPEINPEIKVLYYDGQVIAFFKASTAAVHPCGRYNRNSLVNIWREGLSREQPPIGPPLRCINYRDAGRNIDP